MTEKTKEAIFSEIENDLIRQGFTIDSQDENRPWGGFYVINENQAQEFSNVFFEGISVHDIMITGKLSPKILLISPGIRLSWQYHHRRAEIWQVVQGSVGVISSATDVEGELRILKAGDEIRVKQGERHRLVGLKEWGVVAEIWQHTNPDYPSDEDDIVRVQDDFGR